MKKLKAIFSTALAFAMTFIVSTSCFATSPSNQGLTEPTERFVEMCDNLFNNPEEYKALDKAQNDVTNMFINKYAPYYNSKEYNVLLDAFKLELYRIIREKETQKPTTGTLDDRSVEKSFYVIDETTEFSPGKTFEMTYTVSGDYSFDSSTRQIVDYSDAQLNIDYFWAGSAFDYHLFGVSTSATPTSGNNRVNFRATFSLTLEFEYDINNFPITAEEDFGPYSGSVLGYAQ